MTTKHTPGPWKAFGGVIQDSKGRAVARAGCLSDLDETDSNVRLIAAAPAFYGRVCFNSDITG